MERKYLETEEKGCHITCPEKRSRGVWCRKGTKGKEGKGRGVSHKKRRLFSKSLSWRDGEREKSKGQASEK